MSAPELSIVLPCYNEARGIPQILTEYGELASQVEFELVLVNNGSRDDSQAVLDRLVPQYPFARSVTIDANKGYGDGIFTGLKAAKGRFLAWSHADLQCSPGDVLRAYRTLWESPAPEKTIVKGHRRGRRLRERVISRGMEIAAACLLRTALREINAQPKVFHHSLLAELPNPPIDFNFDVYVLYRAKRLGWTFRSIEVQFPPRKYGTSNWSATLRSRCRTIWRSVKYMTRLGLGRA